ncbi:hypothetical protein COCC4DRAFT_194471 [Bipolaris maydis ATCC 48331]|uniref:Uncharacterized protein n=2 Tax=Cochliobolus heterostrophus TaxID=5016 RepID=M2UBC5_COCH5|nr:uncharacterized protein COCC4DRAFT_194471 [Bipolaris maydis ATCC 48331]EMD91011.1 hypothetical protein COCHEDRAFT_1194726 [Bipolaris maydis C5]ENI05905.1 hypothetical protein COCC4DRAFT_194471 [Bipolaris maydis ATCC 48331]
MINLALWREPAVPLGRRALRSRSRAYLSSKNNSPETQSDMISPDCMLLSIFTMTASNHIMTWGGTVGIPFAHCSSLSMM